MSDKLSVQKKPALPAVVKKTKYNGTSALVGYELIDSSHYSFSYSFNDDYKFRMDETEQASDHTKFVDVDFVDDIPESDKAYYALAAVSGMITGMISTFHIKENELLKLADIKEKNWKNIIVVDSLN